MLGEWTQAACRALDLDADDLDQAEILDLARDIAHGVARPAAPLTAYLLGLAVGRGRARADAVTAVRTLIEGWPAPTSQ